MHSLIVILLLQVDGLDDELQMFFEPEYHPLDTLDYQQLLNKDPPFYGDFGNDQYALFEGGPAVQDAASDQMTQFLNFILNVDGDSSEELSSQKADGYPQNEMEHFRYSHRPDTCDSMSAIPSVSSSEADAEMTAPLPRQVRRFIHFSLRKNI